MLEDEEFSVPEESGNSVLPWIALIIGFLGGGVGGTALYFNYTLNEKISAMEDTLETRRGETSENVASLKSSINTLNEEFQGIKDNLVSLRAQLRRDRTDQADKLAEVYKAINENREQINENVGAIAEIPETLTSTVDTSPQERETERAPGVNDKNEETREDTRTETSGNIIHTIEAGDYFGKLSREYDVPLADILEANPTVNPNKLQIGQEVVIPGKR